MSGSAGGNSSPSEPDAVNNPNAKRSRYPSLISAGNSTPPSAKIVTPDPPVKTVKNEHSTAQNREQRHAEHGRDRDNDQPRPRRAALGQARRTYEYNGDCETSRRGEPMRPRRPRLPHQTKRDHAERHGQHGLRHPRRNPRADRRLRLALGRDHLHAAPGEHERGTRGDRRGKDVRDAARRAGGNERAGGEREQLALARGDGGAKEADPEGQVLNDGTGGGDADA